MPRHPNKQTNLKVCIVRVRGNFFVFPIHFNFYACAFPIFCDETFLHQQTRNYNELCLCDTYPANTILNTRTLSTTSSASVSCFYFSSREISSSFLIHWNFCTFVRSVRLQRNAIGIPRINNNQK